MLCSEISWAPPPCERRKIKKVFDSRAEPVARGLGGFVLCFLLKGCGWLLCLCLLDCKRFFAAVLKLPCLSQRRVSSCIGAMPAKPAAEAESASLAARALAATKKDADKEETIGPKAIFVDEDSDLEMDLELQGAFKKKGVRLPDELVSRLKTMKVKSFEDLYFMVDKVENLGQVFLKGTVWENVPWILGRLKKLWTEAEAKQKAGLSSSAAREEYLEAPLGG